VGSAVSDVSAESDRYWNSPSAAPAPRLLSPAGPEEVRRLESRFTSVRAEGEAQEYVPARYETILVRELLANRLPSSRRASGFSS
jgi:putative cardiolipin synthase